eukprot:5678762-Prymnesium_polylepis.2
MTSREQCQHPANGNAHEIQIRYRDRLVHVACVPSTQVASPGASRWWSGGGGGSTRPARCEMFGIRMGMSFCYVRCGPGSMALANYTRSPGVQL